MALLATSFFWVAAVVVVAILALASLIFVSVFAHTREKSVFVSTVSIVSLTALLTTACLLPVDIALIASTTDNHTGLKKDWATPDAVYNIVLSLQVVYYMLYSLDALLIWIVIPFTYFWYEEWDVDSTAWSRIRGALRYTLVLFIIIVILFIVGFFFPREIERPGKHWDFDYFKKLLVANHGERALSFVVGILLVIGTFIYVFYTGTGMALFPIYLVKSIPAVSVASAQDARDALIINRERQRMLEAREVSSGSLNANDRREMEQLQKEERMLVRRQRLAKEAHHKWIVRIMAVFRPFKILFGIILLTISALVVASMLITCIDKLSNSRCGRKCGYVLTNPVILNPVNWIFLKLAKVFPIDYVFQLLLVLFMFSSTVAGLSYLGIKVLWMTIWRVKVKRTKPQSLLMSTAMLMLTVLAINYSFSTIIAPQYATFGGQKYCARTTGGPGTGSPHNCTNHEDFIMECSSLSTGDAADICTPTVVTTFINRMTMSYPGLGNAAFYMQFAFVGLFILTLAIGWVRSPKMDYDSADEDEVEAEEESLLAAAGTRIRGAWDDVRGGPAGGEDGAGRTYSSVSGAQH